MINMKDIMETVQMIEEEHSGYPDHYDGDFASVLLLTPDIDRSCQKGVRQDHHLRQRTWCRWESRSRRNTEFPIINKRISVTPIAMLVAASGGDPVKYALTLDRAAKEVGVNFIGGYSALVHKGFAAGDKELIESIPRALAQTEFVCSSVNIGSTKTGINMDAVGVMGKVVCEAARLTADWDCIGAAKLVVFCNAPEDNPFMAGAFHGPGEPECVINVGVSGPGVVRAALDQVPRRGFDRYCGYHQENGV